jgi:hypothetical protein
MGVNRPSVKLSDLTTDGEIRATRNLAEKKARRKCVKGERESARQGWKRTGETRKLREKEKESNLRPDFSVSGEGE